MMKSVLDRAFSSPATQPDKDAIRHLRDALRGTHSLFSSVLFDILETAARKDRAALAEIAFLIGAQAGYELGIEHPPPPTP